MRVIRILALSAVLALSVIGILVLKEVFNRPSIKSAFTHEEIKRINPVFILSQGVLMNPEFMAEAVQEMLRNLELKGMMVQTPFGPMLNPQVRGYAIPIIIQSPGGRVKLGNDLKNLLRSMKNEGLLIHCYVGEAQSMAFNIMVTMCDKVIAKRSARIMQHRTHCGKDCSTASTVYSDVKLTQEEAQALNVSYDEWLKVARGEEDHVFTPEEIEKYKLVDEWM